MKSRRSTKVVLLILAVALLGGALIAPVGAHFQQNIGHLFFHVKKKTGRVLVVEAREFSSATFQSVRAECPTGKRPIGGGASTETNNPTFGEVQAPPTVAIVRSKPEGRYWEVYAREMDPYGADWRVKAHVFCSRL